MGVDVHGFYGSLSKRLGITEKQAEEQAEQGKISPQILLNAIYEQIEKRQGGKLGKGAIAMSKTMEARLDKLASLPDKYLKSIVDSPAWPKLSEKLGTLYEALDPSTGRGKKITAALMAAFEKLADFVDRALTPENIDKFADGAVKVVEALGKLPQILDTIVTVSEVIATIWAGMKIVSGVNAIAGALPTLATVAGKGVALTTAATEAATGATAAEAATSLAVGGAAAAPVAGALGALAIHDTLLDIPMQAAGEKLRAAQDQGTAPKWYDLKGIWDLAAQPAPNKAGGAPGGNTVNVTNNVTVNAAAGDDPAHTAQETAQQIGYHTTNEFNKASQEWGR
jgi:hypothetical protein